MKHMAKKGKNPSKSGVLGVKSGYLELEKIRVGNQTRKAKWCKMQVVFLKIDITKDTKVINSAYLPTLWPIFSLERSEIWSAIVK